MPVYQLRPCPFCSGLAPRWRLAGKEEYKKIMCYRCGTFVLEPTLPTLAWTRLDAEDMALVVFLPAYIWRRNRRNKTPLLTLGNWRALARRACLVVLPSPSPATSSLSR